MPHEKSDKRLFVHTERNCKKSADTKWSCWDRKEVSGMEAVNKEIEEKNSIISLTMLGAFIIIIVGHTIEYNMLAKELIQIQSQIAFSIAMDFIFIFLSFLGYLWIAELEAKKKKVKNIDNSLNWLWSKV